jgi:hypothetical protein
VLPLILVHGWSYYVFRGKVGESGVSLMTARARSGCAAWAGCWRCGLGGVAALGLVAWLLRVLMHAAGMR